MLSPNQVTLPRKKPVEATSAEETKLLHDPLSHHIHAHHDKHLPLLSSRPYSLITSSCQVSNKLNYGCVTMTSYKVRS